VWPHPAVFGDGLRAAILDEEPKMSAEPPSVPATTPIQREPGLVTGLVVFAGTLMIIVGVFHALVGIAALVDDEIYVTTPNYLYSADITGWGWLHLLLGTLVAVVGIAVLQGRAWGRVVGIGLAALSLVVNFLFIPYHALWSVLIIALEVAIIWALAAYRELA
jgi:vacuolar-type H+-ATPase subunit I/STV1